jgi:hypothetical protein
MCGVSTGIDVHGRLRLIVLIRLLPEQLMGKGRRMQLVRTDFPCLKNGKLRDELAKMTTIRLKFAVSYCRYGAENCGCADFESIVGDIQR